ncbi:3-isopropylmalate dehydrogenase [Starmerella bacillaris]|uniref:3-isopropylmalate dehydrogenase n=1 Tax=Starmerella bacillaris TaxID=1247836 RepID=A0AAV5RLJ3_STABA|nr:3-isopropylmalate dehydrogenase [Starmerella bacillaris]
MTEIRKTIVVLPGDHVGTEITTEAVKVLKAVENSLEDVHFNFLNHLIGGAAIDATGDPLPDETLAAAKNADAVLLGAVGGPKWGTGSVRPEQGLLKIRKELNLYANLRPCSILSEKFASLSPLKSENVLGTDIMIVRELTGGIYFGDRTEADMSAKDPVAVDTEKYSVSEITRIARMAGFLAMQSSPPLPVWSLDKANVLASSRLWRKVVTDIFNLEFPSVKLEHQLIDSAAMILVKNPRQLNGVVITTNMFGDIISDEASVIPGSLGFLPSASLSGLPNTNSAFGLYEPSHGSAPDLERNKVNPVATILSAAMMLKLSLGLPEAGRAVEEAVKYVLENVGSTGDIGGSLSTVEVGDAIAAETSKRLEKNA